MSTRTVWACIHCTSYNAGNTWSSEWRYKHMTFTKFHKGYYKVAQGILQSGTRILQSGTSYTTKWHNEGLQSGASYTGKWHNEVLQSGTMYTTKWHKGYNLSSRYWNISSWQKVLYLELALAHTQLWPDSAYRDVIVLHCWKQAR